jgi:hypothetical protein
VPNGATSRIGSSFRASLSRLTPTPKQITPAFSVGAGVWRQEGEGGREVCWCQLTSPGRRRGWGEWHGLTPGKMSITTDAPALNKFSALGAQKKPNAPSDHVTCLLSYFFFVEWARHGVRGRVLRLWDHNAGATEKKRWANHAG